jgi:hypothetical protein
MALVDLQPVDFRQAVSRSRERSQRTISIEHGRIHKRERPGSSTTLGQAVMNLSPKLEGGLGETNKHLVVHQFYRDRPRESKRGLQSLQQLSKLTGLVAKMVRTGRVDAHPPMLVVEVGVLGAGCRLVALTWPSEPWKAEEGHR